MSETRQSSALQLERQNALTWPRAFISKFIEPGLVHYEQFGTELLSKSTLDACVQSFVGKPVIIRHSKVTPETCLGKAVGYISRVWAGDDGWYHCEGIITDDQAKALIEDGWSVSCSYRVTQTGAGGKHHNLDYTRELTHFEGEHLALVETPRYEDAAIRLNEKPNQSKMNKFKIWFSKITGADRENSAPKEVDAEKAVVSVSGKNVPLKDLIAGFKAKKAEDAERDNAIPTSGTVEIDGELVSVEELLRANALVEDKGGRIGLVAKKKKRENEEEEGDESDEDGERKNTDKAEKKDRENGKSAFQQLRTASANVHLDSAGDVKFNADTISDRVARGREMFSLPAKK